MAETLELNKVYARRFAPDVAFRRRMWQVLCRDFFQRYVPADSVVMELGAGYCEFLNSIAAARKIAVDLNEDTRQHAAPGTEVHLSSTTRLDGIPDGSVDVAWASNFFEHLTRADIVSTLRETRRVLKPGGRFLVLQPNIRFCQRDYWMFFDHITPLDDRSLTEVLELNGFEVREVIVRFLPYTTKSRLPNSLWLLRLYLKLPLAWRIFGQQSFLVATAVEARA